jgi:type IV secretory pathway component VirB8
VRALGKDGHVSLQNFRFHPLAIGKDGETRRYLVQFDRTVWHAETRDPTQPWSATVDFQWHPELSMLPSDRTDNPGGFQVLGYSASSDTPAKTRE